MLKVPEAASGTRLSDPVPCFRCLFVKDIPDSWCDPQTCEMLEQWLLDRDFSWDKYYTGWSLRLSLKAIKKNGLPENEQGS